MTPQKVADEMESVLSQLDAIEECEALIRAGQVQKVAGVLARLKMDDVLDSNRLSLAQICRRAGLISLGLKVLNPLIEETNRAKGLPTDRLWSEYAVLLQRKGLLQQSAQFLAKVNPDRAPESLLYTAFWHSSTWNYKAAVAPLQDFIRRTEDPYRRLVGKVNLAAAYVNTEMDAEATEFLPQFQGEARDLKALRLFANLLELSAEVKIRSGELDSALQDLDAANHVFGEEKTKDQFFVLKWRAVIESIKTKSTNAIQEFRAEALARRDFESVRESDFQSLLIEYDLPKLEQLYMGTPHAAYRERIIRRIGRRPPADSLLWTHAREPNPSDPILDLQNGIWKRHQFSDSGRKFLLVLMNDLYRPKTLGALFSSLYEGEQYNPFSSSDRVQQALRRFRQELEETEVPLTLRHQKGLYWIETEPGIAVLIPESPPPLDPREAELLDFLQRWPRLTNFDRVDLQETMGLVKGKALELIELGIQRDMIHVFGRGKGIRYRQK